MDFSFLPSELANSLSLIDINKLSEIRLRNNYPIIVKYGMDRLYLCESGITIFSNSAFKCKTEDINNIIDKITEHSIYAYNDKIKQSYITLKSGVRVGLVGECVYSNGQIHTIKNFSSLNIRIPHNIVGCSDFVFKYVYDENINNTLIVSPVGRGKTTLLKDVARNLNATNKCSILIIDERGEFANVEGENIDKITDGDKLYAFNNCLRSMAPDVIITDELSTDNDWRCVKSISSSGVKIIASCHGKTLEDVINKENFSKGIFDRYVVISHSGTIGAIDAIYDKEFKVI